MKTVLQELIEKLQNGFLENKYNNSSDIIYECNESLEKEKQQIIDAHCAGQDIEDTAGVTDALEYIKNTYV